MSDHPDDEMPMNEDAAVIVTTADDDTKAAHLATAQELHTVEKQAPVGVANAPVKEQDLQVGASIETLPTVENVSDDEPGAIPAKQDAASDNKPTSVVVKRKKVVGPPLPPAFAALNKMQAEQKKAEVVTAVPLVEDKAVETHEAQEEKFKVSGTEAARTPDSEAQLPEPDSVPIAVIDATLSKEESVEPPKEDNSDGAAPVEPAAANVVKRKTRPGPPLPPAFAALNKKQAEEKKTALSVVEVDVPPSDEHAVEQPSETVEEPSSELATAALPTPNHERDAVAIETADAPQPVKSTKKDLLQAPVHLGAEPGAQANVTETVPETAVEAPVESAVKEKEPVPNVGGHAPVALREAPENLMEPNAKDIAVPKPALQAPAANAVTEEADVVSQPTEEVEENPVHSIVQTVKSEIAKTDVEAIESQEFEPPCDEHVADTLLEIAVGSVSDGVKDENVVLDVESAKEQPEWENAVPVVAAQRTTKNDVDIDRQEVAVNSPASNEVLAPKKLQLPHVFNGKPKEIPVLGGEGVASPGKLKLPGAFDATPKAEEEKVPASFPKPGKLSMPEAFSDEKFPDVDEKAQLSESTKPGKLSLPGAFGNSDSSVPVLAISVNESAAKPGKLKLPGAFGSMPDNTSSVEQEAVPASPKKKLAIPSAFGASGADSDMMRHLTATLAKQDDKTAPFAKNKSPETVTSLTSQAARGQSDAESAYPEDGVELPVEQRHVKEATMEEPVKSSGPEKLPPPKKLALPSAFVGNTTSKTEAVPGNSTTETEAIGANVKENLADIAPVAQPVKASGPEKLPSPKKLALPGAFSASSDAVAATPAPAPASPKKKLAIPSAFSSSSSSPDTKPAAASDRISKKLAVPAAFGGNNTSRESAGDNEPESAASSTLAPASPAKKLAIPAAFDEVKRNDSTEAGTKLVTPPSPKRKLDIPATFGGTISTTDGQQPATSDSAEDIKDDDAEITKLMEEIKRIEKQMETARLQAEAKKAEESAAVDAVEINVIMAKTFVEGDVSSAAHDSSAPMEATNETELSETVKEENVELSTESTIENVVPNSSVRSQGDDAPTDEDTARKDLEQVVIEEAGLTADAPTPLVATSSAEAEPVQEDVKSFGTPAIESGAVGTSSANDKKNDSNGKAAGMPEMAAGSPSQQVQADGGCACMIL